MIKDSLKNKRLQAIFDLLSDDLTLADVGSDHGYLPIHYALSYPTRSAYAADVAVEPLNSAKKNIELNNLGNRVIPILSDGLKEIPSDANGLVIAGMGVDTIIEILEQSKDKWQQFEEIILQPNLKVERLRRYLITNNFQITDEICVKDRKKFYIILKVSTLKVNEQYSEQELDCGKYLKHKHSFVYLEYCQLRLRELEKIIHSRKTIDRQLLSLRNSFTQEIEWRNEHGIK